MTYRRRYRLLRSRYPHHGRLVSALLAHTMRDEVDWKRFARLCACGQPGDYCHCDGRPPVPLSTCPGGPACPWFDYDSELRHHVDECGIFIER